MTPDLAVILTARDDITALAHLIPEIVVVLGGRAFEIIVVDDGSTDRTRPLWNSCE